MKAETVRRRVTRLVILGAAALLVAGGLMAPPLAKAGPAQNEQVTAEQQSNRISDLDITRNIRRALVKDKSLSIRAHNIDIITRSGKVTLRGRVDSDAEKATIESVAARIAGTGNFTDELTTSH